LLRHLNHHRNRHARPEFTALPRVTNPKTPAQQHRSPTLPGPCRGHRHWHCEKDQTRAPGCGGESAPTRARQSGRRSPHQQLLRRSPPHRPSEDCTTGPGLHAGDKQSNFRHGSPIRLRDRPLAVRREHGVLSHAALRVGGYLHGDAAAGDDCRVRLFLPLETLAR